MQKPSYEDCLAVLMDFSHKLYQSQEPVAALNKDEVYMRLAMACVRLEEIASLSGEAERKQIEGVVSVLKSVAISPPFFPIDLVQK